MKQRIDTIEYSQDTKKTHITTRRLKKFKDATIHTTLIAYWECTHNQNARKEERTYK